MIELIFLLGAGYVFAVGFAGIIVLISATINPIANFFIDLLKTAWLIIESFIYIIWFFSEWNYKLSKILLDKVIIPVIIKMREE
jgi:hypothetical protein